jgi:excisionase family DNA binding protein
MLNSTAVRSEFMSIEETARRTNVHPITIKRAISDGDLECFRVRKRVLIAESAWREWLNQCRVSRAAAA